MEVGGAVEAPHDILPIWIFFQASEAVNMQESMIPATVNVPPTMAQIVVMKRYSGCLLSVYLTVIGLRSYRNQMAGMIRPVWL